jgi:hypothetical protein
MNKLIAVLGVKLILNSVGNLNIGSIGISKLNFIINLNFLVRFIVKLIDKFIYNFKIKWSMKNLNKEECSGLNEPLLNRLEWEFNRKLEVQLERKLYNEIHREVKWGLYGQIQRQLEKLKEDEKSQ